jgi:hypothetical protein
VVSDALRRIGGGLFEPAHLQVAAFICLGVFLRIYNFAKPGLWIDEYSTWWVLAGGDWTEVARRNIRFDGYSPLYPYIVKPAFDLLGDRTVSLRLPSIFFGVGVLGLAYPLGLRIVRDRHAATLTVAAFAVSEPLIYFSQDARPHSLALFCTMLSFLYYVSLLEKERLSCRIGHLLATAGAYYAHYLFGLIMVVQALHLLVMRDRARFRSRMWAITGVILALLCLPGLIQVSRFYRHRASWEDLEPTGALGPVHLALDFLDPWVLFPTAILAVAMSIVGNGEKKLHSQGLGLILVWFLAPIAVFSVVPPLFGISLLRKRYVLASIPAAVFLVAWCMAIGRRTLWQRWLPLALFLTLTTAWNLLPEFRDGGTFAKRLDPGWNHAAAFIGENASADDLILYRVGSVEANRLALPNPDPLLLSFVGWPVAAHLPVNLHSRLVGLPYSASPETATYLTSVRERAIEARRVWIVGSGAVLTRFAEALLQSQRFRVRRHHLYKSVVLLLLEREDALCDGRCK